METSPASDSHGRERAFAETFVRFADALVDDFDVGVLLHDLVDSCVALLDVDAAGVLLRQGGSLEVAAASTTPVHDIEVFQVQTHEGPCQESVRSGKPVTVENLEEGEARWPRFNEVALRRGYRAVHAIPLRLRGEIIGGLGLFHKHLRPWPEGDLAIARALADVATIGIIQNRLVADARTLTGQLQQALDSRVLIEQAKGMLTEPGRIDPDGAFVLLRSYARSHNAQLREVCRRVLAGDLTAQDLATVR